MTNEQLEAQLKEVISLLADVTKEVASLVKAKPVTPASRPQQANDAAALLAKLDALQKAV